MTKVSFGIVVALFALSGCSNSTNGTSTPDGFKGGAPNPQFDASIPVDDTPPAMVDAGANDCGTGATWGDLYCNYFGRAGTTTPGCNGDGKCHGDPMQAGALGSGGFVCGKDKDSCYEGITGMTVGLVLAKDKADPAGSYLLNEIRHKKNGATVGSMPKRPATYSFSDDAIKQISDWIAAGAPNN